MNFLRRTVCFWTFFTVVFSSPECERKSVCKDCILIPSCSWCTRVKSEIVSGLTSGCFSREKTLRVCEGTAYIENPRSSVIILASRPMRNGRNGNSVQIRPQEMTIKARPGDPITIDIEFQKAEDYPVDLYYLMDFSSSMYKHKKNLSRLGNKLAQTMMNLTSDFRLGFGTFVDKVTLPFTSTLPSHLLHPCPRCRSPYSYKNHMSLSKDTDRFAVEVDEAEMSGNIDTPEGVFDGLMQAMVCKNTLKWREKARHIIVVSTDAPFHLAGDGKLGGVIEPNDELCHLDEEGYYTHSLQFDYPSVSQINYQSMENNMNIIFAVVNKVKHEYESLTREIRGASLGLLDAGENIAELIKAQYEKISSTVRLTENSQGPVSVSFSARCFPQERWKNVGECHGVKGGSLIHFRVHLMVSDCSSAEFRKQDITIKPEGINDTLVIHLETICDCLCRTGNEKNSTHCSRAGDLVCGQCVCQEGKIGEKCECTGDDERILSIKDTDQCVTNPDTNELCSGRGDCKCGTCQCHQRIDPDEEYSGKHCECDNFSCERVNGVLCGGHGTCDCGKCACEPEWTGSKCDCPVGVNECRATKEDPVCSGRGICICGTCLCNSTADKELNQRYSGKYCQNCMTCEERCQDYDACVQCFIFDNELDARKNCQNCPDKFHIKFVDNLEGIRANETGNECTGADTKGCKYTYVYDYNEDGQTVSIWTDKIVRCPEQVNMIAVIAGTVGGTVALGILSLIAWKVITDIHDKREYEKFERERHLACWGKEENPLFKKPTTTYENPTCLPSDTCTKKEDEATIA